MLPARRIPAVLANCRIPLDRPAARSASWYPLLADAAGYYYGLLHFVVTAAAAATRMNWPPGRLAGIT